MMKIQIKDILIFAGILAVILLLVFKKKPEQIFHVEPVKKIETRIEGKETFINTIEKRIGNETKIISEITSQIEFLRAELMNVKNKRDTFQIIQIQDTLINSLSNENWRLKNIVRDQDSIIVAQRYIINSKDTLISIGKFDLKRVKKQRNISLFFNALQTGIIIFK